jgi:hypothetical protein
MPRITVRDVLDRVERWRAVYASPISSGPNGVADPERGEHTGQSLQRQAHDGEVVAVDARDDRRTVALDAVGARLVHRLARRDVGIDLGARERMEGDAHLLDRGVYLAAPRDGHRR